MNNPHQEPNDLMNNPHQEPDDLVFCDFLPGYAYYDEIGYKLAEPIYDLIEWLCRGVNRSATHRSLVLQ